MFKTVVKGTGEKILLVTSGLHGNEYTAIQAVSIVAQMMSFTDAVLKNFKEIRFIECINEYGIVNNVRENKIDMNRIFTSDKSSIELIKQEVDEADYIIDIHSSPSCTEFALINQNRFANAYVEFCIQHSIKYAVWTAGSPGTVKSYGIPQGKVTFTVECNGIGYVDITSAANTAKIIINIIKNIHTFVHKDEMPKYQTLVAVNSPIDGIACKWSNTKARVIHINEPKHVEIEYINPKTHTYICFNEGYISCGDAIAYTQPIEKII